MAEAAPNNRIHVGNLPEDFTQEELRAAFEPCGAIAEVEKAGGARRFGWVSFADAAGTAAGLAMNGKVLKEGTEGVKVALSEPKKPRAPRAPKGEDGPAAEHTPDPFSVWVGGLPYEATPEDLAAAFSQYGEVARSRIVRRGRFGVVKFATEAAATAALAHDGKELNGQEVKVETANKVQRRRNRNRKPRAAGGAAADGAAAAGEAKPKAARKRPERKRKANTRIRVTGFPEGTAEGDVKALFASAGDITGVETVDGAVVITFAQPDQALAGRQLAPSMGGAELKVGFFLPPRPRRRPQRRAAGEGGSTE